MSRYNKGRIAEYKVRDRLKEAGYIVTRSAGSKGVFDLIALRGDIGLAIQVKSGCKVGKDEFNKFMLAAIPECIHKVIWEFGSKFGSKYERVRYYK